MRIVCVSYRDWALKIYENIAYNPNNEVLIIKSREQYSEQQIIDFFPDLILFYGWSWKVDSKIINRFTSIMLHPSPLPKYRGGSPIQNQIINGETDTMVTLFIMNNMMDAGDIIAQKVISLEGHLSEIFSKITEVGTELTFKILNEGYTREKQNDKDATYFKRRKPEESEITINELQSKSSTYLYNKIRMLEDPYPNAFIRTVDGKKLKIKLAELE